MTQTDQSLHHVSIVLADVGVQRVLVKITLVAVPLLVRGSVELESAIPASHPAFQAVELALNVVGAETGVHVPPAYGVIDWGRRLAPKLLDGLDQCLPFQKNTNEPVLTRSPMALFN